GAARIFDRMLTKNRFEYFAFRRRRLLSPHSLCEGSPQVIVFRPNFALALFVHFPAPAPIALSRPAQAVSASSCSRHAVAISSTLLFSSATAFLNRSRSSV